MLLEGSRGGLSTLADPFANIHLALAKLFANQCILLAKRFANKLVDQRNLSLLQARRRIGNSRKLFVYSEKCEIP